MQNEPTLQPDLVGPDPTTNPELKHYAFSRGYRAALQEKRLTDMPSGVRRSKILRNEYENGWQTAKAELVAGKQFNRTGYIRHRITWIVITAIAGLATAYLMIGSIKFERSFQALPQLILGTAPNNKPAEIPIANPAKPFTDLADDSSLDLFSTDERQTLASIQLEETFTSLPRQTVVKHDLSVQFALLDSSQQLEIVDKFVPKNIRNLTASFNFDQAQTFKVRWLWQRNLIQETTFNNTKIIGDKIQLASAWQGEWEIELLDEIDQLLYLYQFFYANHPNGLIDEK